MYDFTYIKNEKKSINDEVLNNFFSSSASPYYTSHELINNFTNHPDLIQLSILHLNSRSLFHKMSDLEILIQELKCFFNIIIITETWLNEISAQLINLI